MLNNFRVIFFTVSIFYLFIISCDNSTSNTKDVINKPVSENNIKENIALSDKVSYELQLKTDSLNVELRLKLAAIYYGDREFNKAIQNYLKVSEIENDNLVALISLGNLYYDSGNNEKAIEFYAKSLEIEPNNLNVRCDMGTCYGRIDRIDEAIKIYKENIEVDFNHAQSHYNLSVFLNKIGETEEAQKEMVIFNGLSK